MRDLAPDPRSSDIELIAEPACCPRGACGPIYETPLLELAFNRIRDFVRSRIAATVAEATSTNPLLDALAPAAADTNDDTTQPRKDAPHD